FLLLRYLHSFPTRRSSDLFHMLGLRESLRSHCLRMMQDFVVHLVFLQTIDQSFWYFHNCLRGKKYHFPRLSLVPGQSRWSAPFRDRKSTRLNSSHEWISYA